MPFWPLTVVAIMLILTVEYRRHRSLRRFWDRPCMGIRWRRRFPDAPKTDIREFLVLFVDAFCFDQRRRACFCPDDRVMDVYRADYPVAGLPDCLELEVLGMSLEDRWGVDLETFWRDDITLGEVYEQIRRSAGNR